MISASLFKRLTTQEEADYRLWARQNYKPFTSIDTVWHPIVQHECAAMNVDNWREHVKAI